MVSFFDAGPVTPEEPTPQVKSCTRRCTHIVKKFLEWRFMGLAFGPAYGLVIYLYITYLILAGAPFTREGLDEEEVLNATSKEPEFPPLMTTETSHMIGKSAGIGVGVGLTVSSFFSVRTRCNLTLMIPSLVAKRGRAFMLTFAMGLLIKGPVNNIQFNLQELVRCSPACTRQSKGLQSASTTQSRNG